ncbi:MAG: amidohydrolase, partial [Pseudomonadota bacterium]
MSNTDPVWPLVEQRHGNYAAFSDRVFNTPELLYAERKSCAEHTAMLRAEGFRVTENAAGIPTAVIGEAGEGGPVIAILGRPG